MGELIIGHTTHDSAVVWVRGDKRHTQAQVTLKEQPIGKTICSDSFRLEHELDFTGVAQFHGLDAGTHYRVVADFKPTCAVWKPTAAAGQLRTFPAPDAGEKEFSFLFASCNLSSSRLESIGGMLVSALGMLATSEALKRDRSTWMFPRQTGEGARGLRDRHWSLPAVWRAIEICPAPILRWVARRGIWSVWAAVLQATRFQQPVPRLHSPFSSLLEKLEKGEVPRPAFMLHAGDQIYFDIDAPSRPPEVEEYRRAYRQAWFEDPATRTMLASCPQYMILDDHEILDSFANQPSLREHLTAGRQAYREYVHCRQQRLPCDVLYYSFDYGHARFFVLDTRTERCPEKRQMISDAQLECLKSWLIENRDRLKFVVTSVPFIAELRPDVNPDQFGPPDERSEKWCGEVYRAQRDAIIDLICKEQTSRVVFLVGDMHCTYHATMRIGHPRNRIAIHEIAAGPISQIQFTSRKEFYDQFRGVTHGGNPFSVLLRSFHGSTAAAVRVTVSPSDVSPMLGWSVVPTSSTNGYKPPTMKGYITFAEGGR